METRELICIGCPMGCPITVTMENGEVKSIQGNTCKRGADYAAKEVTNPTRIVTSSVRILGAANGEKAVSCKTASDIPKDRIFDVIRDIKNVTVQAPVHIGDIVRENVAGTGVNMIATKDIV